MEQPVSFHYDHCGPSTTLPGIHCFVSRTDHADYKAYQERLPAECEHRDPDWMAVALNKDRLIVAMVTAQLTVTSATLTRTCTLTHVYLKPTKRNECPLSILMPLLDAFVDHLEPYDLVMDSAHVSKDLATILQHAGWSRTLAPSQWHKTLVPMHLRISKPMVPLL